MCMHIQMYSFICGRRGSMQWRPRHYKHDLNILIWLEIYRGEKHADAQELRIRKKDYYIWNYCGNDLERFRGSASSLRARITLLNQKWSCNKDSTLP